MEGTITEEQDQGGAWSTPPGWMWEDFIYEVGLNWEGIYQVGKGRNELMRWVTKAQGREAAECIREVARGLEWLKCRVQGWELARNKHGREGSYALTSKLFSCGCKELLYHGRVASRGPEFTGELMANVWGLESLLPLKQKVWTMPTRDDLGSSYCPTEADRKCLSGWISRKILGFGLALPIRKSSPMGFNQLLITESHGHLTLATVSMIVSFSSPNPDREREALLGNKTEAKRTEQL